MHACVERSAGWRSCCAVGQRWSDGRGRRVGRHCVSSPRSRVRFARRIREGARAHACARHAHLHHSPEGGGGPLLCRQARRHVAAHRRRSTRERRVRRPAGGRPPNARPHRAARSAGGSAAVGREDRPQRLLLSVPHARVDAPFLCAARRARGGDRRCRGVWLCRRCARVAVPFGARDGVVTFGVRRADRARAHARHRHRPAPV